jgi:hypothetical protein
VLQQLLGRGAVLGRLLQALAHNILHGCAEPALVVLLLQLRRRLLNDGAAGESKVQQLCSRDNGWHTKEHMVL